MIELRKCLLNRGERPSEHFWRDKTGKKADYLLDFGGRVQAFECKAGSTLASDHFRNLSDYLQLRGTKDTGAWLSYGGDGEGQRKGVNQLPWWKI